MAIKKMVLVSTEDGQRMVSAFKEYGKAKPEGERLGTGQKESDRYQS